MLTDKRVIKHAHRMTELINIGSSVLAITIPLAARLVRYRTVTGSFLIEQFSNTNKIFSRTLVY